MRRSSGAREIRLDAPFWAIKDCYCEISDLAWIQAGLPIRDGGLGVRSVALLVPSAFLASAKTTLDLQDAILSEVVLDEDVFVPRVAARWGEMFQSEPLSGKAACS